jgi:AmmeMemoRadiSam system protein B
MPHRPTLRVVTFCLLLLSLQLCACGQRVDRPGRIVAFGDVHGDLEATLKVLQLAGATDENGRWVGGDLTVVQTGDQIDRGHEDRAVLDLFTRLEQEAAAAGGRFIALNGNHELMNVYSDLRYITTKGFGEFQDLPLPAPLDSQLAALPADQRARVAAFRPGGHYALQLAERPVVKQLGENIFVHGGVYPEQVAHGFDKLNAESTAWLRGEIDRPDWVKGHHSLVWSRNYSVEPDSCDCDTLAMTLDAAGAKRMIVGHTVMEDGIRTYCDDRVWCIDTGNSIHYGGRPQVLEIMGDSLRVITGPPPVIRAQRDTIGFAKNPDDMQAVVEAVYPEPLASAPYVAAIMPHDDYLYAGPTAAAVLPGLQAKTWIVVGVCHACRRVGLRNEVLLDDADLWRVAGQDFPVDTRLRKRLLGDLADQGFAINTERHAAEHSIEALLPWLEAASPEFRFVPLLISGMELSDIQTAAADLAEALAVICRERNWQPGRDIGILISADAVHYGCDGWGSRNYAPFGCDAAGHAQAVAQDIDLAGTLCGPLDTSNVETFCSRVWDVDGPDYPDYPYKITWCGLYSIPFGLTAAHRLMMELDLPPLQGELLHYGDSVSDGRLELPESGLGVTAPNTLGHWVGYPAIGWLCP